MNHLFPADAITRHYDQRASGSFAYAVALLWTQRQWVLILSSLHNAELTTPSPGTRLGGPLHAFLSGKGEWGQVCIGPEVPTWNGPHQCAGLLTTAITWPHRISKSARKYSSPYKIGETGCAAQSQEQISQVQNPKASHPSP